jgi:prevent-host-death family protein
LTGHFNLAILAIMKTATITEAKNGLSALIMRVRAGESVLITDRGIPVAVIEPVGAQIDWDERMARLERDGIVRRGTGPLPLELLRKPGPNVGADVVQYLVEERRTGR